MSQKLGDLFGPWISDSLKNPFSEMVSRQSSADGEEEHNGKMDVGNWNMCCLRIRLPLVLLGSCRWARNLLGTGYHHVFTRRDFDGEVLPYILETPEETARAHTARYVHRTEVMYDQEKEKTDSRKKRKEIASRVERCENWR